MRTATVPKSNDALERSSEQREVKEGLRGVSVLEFRIAVIRHHRIVYRTACALLGDKHEAEDVAHEAFLRYWQQGGYVRGAREWLLKVARNACLDRLRRARSTVDVESISHEYLHDTHDPAWHLDQMELATQLRNSISALPEPQRSLIVLFDVHGLDGASCARILGLNRNQVKVYLHRARRRLREQLEGSR
jgi:RNA polymerase sigma-70 factor (ECF subfamily)